MRSCRHCGHQNADHLGYCSQCGKRLGPVTAVPLLPRAPTPRSSGADSTMAVTAALSATSPTMMSLSPAAQALPPGPQAALADIAASERLQSGEDVRLGAQEAALEAEWRACDAARLEADEMLRPVTVQSQEVAARAGRVRERLAAHERDAEAAAAQ